MRISLIFMRFVSGSSLIHRQNDDAILPNSGVANETGGCLNIVASR